MGNIFYIILGVIFLLIIFRVRKDIKVHSKILNALHAKHTFNTLDKQLQSDVLQVTIMILHRGGYPDPQNRFNNFSEIQKYGFIALALAELKISSIIKKYEWQYVEKPQIIPDNIERKLKSAEALFYKDNGIMLTLRK